MKTILIDPSRCIQCCNCQNSCKDEHCDNDWSPIAAKQGSGQFWIKINESQAADGSRMRLNRVPVTCQHCESCALVDVAPDAVYVREDGIVIIDPEAARGNEALVDACPYHTVYWNADLQVAQKCTMCAHLLDAGWEKPRCVTACPTDALSFVEASELTAENLYAPLERMNPEFGTKPRVAYVNIPKPFVAGAVYSPSENICLEKVDLVLSNQATGEKHFGRTGLLGEFRIENVAPGYYTLQLDKDGYDAKALSSLKVVDGLNVGEIRLIKTPL